MALLKFDSFPDARANLEELLDAALQGRTVVVQRRSDASALVDRARFLSSLQVFNADRVQVIPDDDRWVAAVDHAPLAGEGETADEAVDDLIDALRDYSDDWADRLWHAPNHDANWALVQLVDLSDDQELHGWIMGVGTGR